MPTVFLIVETNFPVMRKPETPVARQVKLYGRRHGVPSLTQRDGREIDI